MKTFSFLLLSLFVTLTSCQQYGSGAHRRYISHEDGLLSEATPHSEEVKQEP